MMLDLVSIVMCMLPIVISAVAEWKAMMELEYLLDRELELNRGDRRGVVGSAQTWSSGVGTDAEEKRAFDNSNRGVSLTPEIV
jgi:hypothetical protein